MKTISTYSQMTLQRFRPNRRRGWKRKLGGWLWIFVWMLALWLALWGAFSWVSGARPSGPSTINAEPSTLLQAGFGASDSVAVVIVLSVIVGLLVRLVLGARVEAQVVHGMKCPHCRSGLLWSEDRGAHCDGCDDFDPETDLRDFGVWPRGVDWTNGARTNAWDDDPLSDGDTLKREQRAFEAMPEGLPRAMVWEIVNAMAEEVALIRSLVSGAIRTTSVEDYYDSLLGAEKRLAQLRVTLCELRAKFQAESAPSIADRLKPGLQTQGAGPSNSEVLP